ncbi:MAG TPA: hypothetical protein VN871_06190 [Mycobacterium sp.]|nr:hypothetical protein [Mycobacterium sp.]
MLEGPEVRSAEPADIATALTLQVQVGGSQLVMQTYIGRDAPISAYHALTDKLRRVIDRQAWKDMLAQEQETLRNSEKNLANFKRTFDSVEDRHAEEWKRRGKKGDPVIGAKEEAEKHNAKQGMQAGKEAIERSKATIAELQAKLNAEPVTGG